LKKQFGSQAEISLIAGSGGVYEVTVDGRLIFSKKQLGRFPAEGEIIRLLTSS